MITRRALLTGGLGAVAALAIAGAVSYRYAELEDDDRTIIAAIAPVMLGIPNVAPAVVRGVDVAISGLPLEVRAQLRQLFGLLRFPPTRMLAAGVMHPWHAASEAEIAHFLQSWRDSRLVKLRAAYNALHQLIGAAWYRNDAAWPAIGYAGPPKVTG